MKQAIRYERMSQDALDEAVREAKDDEASALNGRGRVAQIAYLTRAEPQACTQSDTKYHKPSVYELDDREHATVLAALRYWQREGLMSSGHEGDIATNGSTLPMMQPHEIDALCERLNCGG